MSQLLCEQVVGRGLRRSSYELVDGKFLEEVSTVFGVPFEVIPYKANPTGGAQPKEKRHHVHALSERERLEIRFPRVESYTQAIRNRVDLAWASVPHLRVNPMEIPTEVQMKGLNVDVLGKLTMNGPGDFSMVDLQAPRNSHRMQELIFDTASHLTRRYVKQSDCTVPPQALFPQLLRIVERGPARYSLPWRLDAPSAPQRHRFLPLRRVRDDQPMASISDKNRAVFLDPEKTIATTSPPRNCRR